MITHDMPQGSQEWLEIRLGKITSTRVKKVLGKNANDVIDELIDETTAGYEFEEQYISPEMEWGSLYEPEARREYEYLNGVEVIQHGFCQSSEMPYLGLSPDGFIGYTEGAVEVKCPKRKTHIRYIRKGGVPSDYWEQVLQYFLVCPTLQWVDFISYHPDFTPKPLYIHRTFRTEVELELMTVKGKLEAFWKKYQEERSKYDQ